MTLYYRTSEKPPTTVCSGGCAGAWPPLLVTGSSAPSASLPGKLSVQTDANGNQVEYNGHLLYTYSGDSAPGQSNGEGVAGVWFVVTPNLT
jgi:predicted lipoprotein with Yx(FWY)xxD motif